MIIYLNTIYKSKIIFKKKIFFCQLGKNGKVTNYKKREGDKCTPTGKFIIMSCSAEVSFFFDKNT